MSEFAAGRENLRTLHLELSQTHPLIFFDGVCGLCDIAVDWILSRDKVHFFRFAPLQGATAAALLDEADLKNLDSLILVKNGRFYRKSSAVLEIAIQMAELPFIVRAAARLALFVPSFLRDPLYSLIAKFRYRIWGQKDVCRLPTSEERAVFFD